MKHVHIPDLFNYECPVCKGTGGSPLEAGDFCKNCGGEGKVLPDPDKPMHMSDTTVDTSIQDSIVNNPCKNGSMNHIALGQKVLLLRDGKLYWCVVEAMESREGHNHYYLNNGKGLARWIFNHDHLFTGIDNYMSRLTLVSNSEK